MVTVERSGTAAADLAAARLDGDDSLAVFRVLLDAAARPGKPVALREDLAKKLPGPMLAVLALIDLDHRFIVLGDDDGDALGRWTPLISAATDARPAGSLRDADVVIARRAPTPQEVGALRTGDAEAPESSARLFVACRSVSTMRGVVAGNHEATDVATTRFAVVGPGAPTPRWLEVVGVAPEVIAAVAAANRSFPIGIDVWFLDQSGTVVGVPRSSQVTLAFSPGGKHDVALDEGAR